MVFAFSRVVLRNSRFVYLAAVLSWLLIGVWMPVAHAQSSEELVARKPFISTNIDGMALTKDKNGTPLAVTIPEGINAPLQIINLRTMQRVYNNEQRVDGVFVTARAYVTLQNRHVLVGTNTGYVYDVDPDKLTAIEQELPGSPRVSFVDAVAADEDTAYFVVQVQSSTHLYRYSAGNGSWQDRGLLPQPDGGLAYEEGKLYSANGLGILSIDAQSGAQTPLAVQNLPAGTTSLRVEAAYGGFLYLATQSQTVVYDLAQAAVVDQRALSGNIAGSLPQETVVTVPAAAPAVAQPVAETNQPSTTPPDTTNTLTTGTSAQPKKQNDPKPTQTQNQSQTQTQNSEQASETDSAQTPSGQTVQAAVPAVTTTVTMVRPPTVYFGALGSYDPTTKAFKQAANSNDMQPVRGNCWLDATRCVVYSRSGRLAVANTTSRGLKIAAPSPLLGGFQPVTALLVAPDDTLYAASGAQRAAVLEADRDRSEARKMVAQPQGAVASMVALEGSVLAGTTTGMIVRYDASTQTTTPSFGRQVSVGAGTVSALAGAARGQVAFGVSQMGAKPSGSVGVYATAKQAVSLPAQTVLNDQSIASLLYHNGTLYIGGSVGPNAAGGAALVAYDLEKRTLKVKTVPVASAKSITSMVVGPEGKLYGLGGATLFEFNPQTLGVARTRLFSNGAGSASNIANRAGQLVVSVGGRVLSVDPTTFADTYVAEGSQVTVNSLGDVYYSRNGGIYRVLAPRQAAAAAGSTEPNSGVGTGSIPINMKLGAGTILAGLLIAAIPVFRLFHRHNVYYVRR